MMKVLRVVWFLGILAVAGVAQDRPGNSSPTPDSSETETRTSVIAGTVSRPGSGEPVRTAMVTLFPQAREGTRRPRNAGEHASTTDRNGQFEFRNIAPGTYRVVVEKNGQMRLRSAGNRVWSPYFEVTVSPGEERRGLVLELQPTVAITGTVKDENGEPLPSVVIRALQPMNSEGRTVVWPAGTATTDEHGEYRISRLMAGAYLLEAVPPSPPPGSRHGYGHVFYPDSTSREEAARIRLRPGDETVADFTLLPSALARVRGQVTGFALRNARIMAGTRNGEISHQAFVNAEGGFELDGLLPGEYTLTVFDAGQSERGERNPRIGVRTIRVEGADIDGVEITASPALRTSSRIQGTVRVASSNVTHGPLASLNVSLLPERGGSDAALPDGMRVSAFVGPDGRIAIREVPPGRYTLHMTTSSPGWEDFYTSSLRVEGVDVTDSVFTIPTSGGTIPVEITISGDGAYVEGTVVDEDNRPVAHASVTGIPDGPLRSQIDAYQQATTDSNGKYRLRGIKPGSYTLFAWESMEDWSFMDPEFLQTYESQGVSVRLGPKERQTIPLRLINTGP